jgi:hypothetical protein
VPWHPDIVATVEILDETVIVVRRETLAAAVGDRARWVAWWPDLDVTMVLDRGIDGMQWSVVGALVGTCEVVLVQQGAGVLVRYALRADPSDPVSRTTGRLIPDSPRGQRELSNLRRRQAMAWKRTVWELKDEFETGAS